MSGLDEREKAFEAKYHLDEELAFKVNARRDKLLGLWASEKLGLTGGDAEAYARTILDADFADAHHETMIKKLLADFAAKGIEFTESHLQLVMQRLGEEAHRQIIHDVEDGTLTISPE